MDAIDDAQARLSLSNKHLAAACGMTKKQLKRLKAEPRSASAQQLRAVANVLGVGVADLFGPDAPEGDGRSPVWAVYVDVENAAGSLLTASVDAALAYGDAKVRRAFADWTCAGAAARDVLADRGFDLVQVTPAASRKNSSDIALSVDAAMLVASNPTVEGLAVVSSDCDFTPLAKAVIERGVAYVGIGRPSSAVRYRNACTEFRTVDDPDGHACVSSKKSRGEGPKQAAAEGIVRSMLSKRKSVRLSTIGDRLHEEGIEHKDLGGLSLKVWAKRLPGVNVVWKNGCDWVTKS